MLEGRRFTVWTDHKPLTSALHRVSEPWTARQQRHLAYIAEYTSDLRHVAGLANVVADTLSRPPVLDVAATAASKPGRVKEPSGSRPASAACGPVMAVAAASSEVDYSWLAREQPGCADTVKALSSPSLRIRNFDVDGVILLCDVSSGAVRPLALPPGGISGHTLHCPPWSAGYQAHAGEPFCLDGHGDGYCFLVQGMPELCQGEDHRSRCR